ncbi:MAG: magnesium transporter CorA family protein [Nitrosospira sp.]|nr:magnesium transporter CorA family protein [Nitrosospira sp.]
MPADVQSSSICVYIDPDPHERASLIADFNIDKHTLSSALDSDEVARIERNAEHLLLIWKRPKNYSGGDTFFFEVGSIGMVLYKERLAVIVKEEIHLIDAEMRDAPPIRAPLDVLLLLLMSTIHHYIAHLKVIRAIAREVEDKIQTSMENKHLIQMFNLSESLVYYLNAINSNGTVLTKLRRHAEKQGFTPETIAFIDDLIIDNDQCYKQAEIYSTVFAGLMDARGNLVNNNVNVLLRNLTLINVVFLPLNLIASIGGMSEFTMITHGVPWWISYPLFCLAISLIGCLTAIVLRKMISKRNFTSPKRGRNTR